MRSILLAAGFGTRLKPLTDKIPKCLVPIKGQALLGIWLQRLSDAQVGPFLINTHYLSEQVEKYLIETSYNEQTTIIHESELLGTAGTLINNIDFYQGNDGLLIHADNYCLADFEEFILMHANRPKQCLLTMMTFQTDTPSSCGIVELDSEGVVTSFHEKVNSPPGDIANGAVYILSAEFLADININYQGANEFSTDILPNYLGKIFTYHTDKTFMDIGTPENYRIANQLNNNLI
jgi:mannose-1-phosphate guanylyltransferase